MVELKRFADKVAVEKAQVVGRGVDITQDMIRAAQRDLQDRLDELFAVAVKTYKLERGPMKYEKLRGGRIRLTLTATLTPRETTAAHLDCADGFGGGDDGGEEG